MPSMIGSKQVNACTQYGILPVKAIGPRSAILSFDIIYYNSVIDD